MRWTVVGGGRGKLKRVVAHGGGWWCWRQRGLHPKSFINFESWYVVESAVLFGCVWRRRRRTGRGAAQLKVVDLRLCCTCRWSTSSF